MLRSARDIANTLDNYYGQGFELPTQPELVAAKDSFVALANCCKHSKKEFLSKCAEHCGDKTLAVIDNFLEPALYEAYPKTGLIKGHLRVYTIEEVALDGRPALRVFSSAFLSGVKIEIIDERSVFLRVVYGSAQLAHMVDPKYRVMTKYVDPDVDNPGQSMTAEEFEAYRKDVLVSKVTSEQYAYLSECLDQLKIQEIFISTNNTGRSAYGVWETDRYIKFSLCVTPSEPVTTLFVYKQ